MPSSIVEVDELAMKGDETEELFRLRVQAQRIMEQQLKERIQAEEPEAKRVYPRRLFALWLTQQYRIDSSCHSYVVMNGSWHIYLSVIDVI